MGTTNLLTFLMCSLIVRVVVHGEVYTSTARLTKLFTSTRNVARSLADCIRREEQKLRDLKGALLDLRRLETISPGSGLRTPEHPIGAFHTVKTFHRLGSVLTQERTNLHALRQHLRKDDLRLPKMDDYTGALKAILRLQSIYNLTTAELMAGTVNHKHVPGMAAVDAYRIGNIAKTQLHDDVLAADWWKEAYNSNRKAPSLSERQYNKLLQKLEQVNLTVAGLTEPEDVKLRTFSSEEGSAIINGIVEGIIEPEVVGDVSESPEYLSDPGDDEDWWPKYMALCRGDQSAIHSDPATSLCIWTDGMTPFEPVKTEILSHRPFVVVYHDVLSDKEGDAFKSEAVHMLSRAMVGQNGGISEHRVGQLAWLDDDTDMLKKISKRISHITGLDVTLRDELSSSEPYQIVNYGIGGQYEPHQDTVDSEKEREQFPDYLFNSGDRLATFLFYLDDVAQGGATVFPRAGIRVPAIKNAAAFWYNLKPSGEQDSLTLHAGCPVLLGQKWVANKWIREHGQELRHRCGLRPDSPHPKLYPKATKTWKNRATST